MLSTARAVLYGIFILHISIGYAGDKESYAARREVLLEKIGDSVAVLRGTPDTRAFESFRQDNNFYYLTGTDIPGSMLLLDGSQRQSILFLPPRDEKKERWEGPHLYPGAEAAQISGMDSVLEAAEFDAELGKRIKNVQVLYTPSMPYETAADSRDRVMAYELARQNDPWDGRKSREAVFRDGLTEKYGAAVKIEDISPILDGMRRVKDGDEIERLRTAGRIGALGLKEAMRAARPGMYEYQLAAIARFVYSWRGSLGEAFFPIVGSGPNSCIPHYDANRRRMEAGEIVVMDYGPDHAYYVSDVTRTFPVSGKFNTEQAGVYSIVLKAQEAALKAVRPGATFKNINDAAESVLEDSGYGEYTMHAVSHYVGMAVHDVGKSEPFLPGVVIAVEPGVYIPDRNLGIRIEDTVLVTENGCEVLTADVPKEIHEIEQLMSSEGGSVGIGD